MDLSKIKLPKDLWEQVIALTIKEKGIDAFLHLVGQLKELGSFEKAEYYSRVRRDVKKFSQSSDMDTPELIQELNKKVAQVKQNYR